MLYSHGGAVYGKTITYDFSTSINPLGMPKECALAIKEAVSSAGCYPDLRGKELREKLADREGILTDNLILGNGAAELIYGLCNAIRPQEVLLPAPSFSEYAQAVYASGGSVHYKKCYPMQEAGKDDCMKGLLQELMAASYDMVFVCNPNNPTGEVFYREQLLLLAKTCEQMGVWLVVDECFLPFLREEPEITMKRYLGQFPHLVVLRAFTKIYGMPGIRLGYGMTGNRELMEKLLACLPPWNTSVLAQAAGKAALEADCYLEQTISYVEQERYYLQKQLKEGCGGMVKQVYPSEANFLFFEAEADLYGRMLDKQILIRDCSSFEGLSKGFYRIAVRTHAENEALIACMQELTAGRV